MATMMQRGPGRALCNALATTLVVACIYSHQSAAQTVSGVGARDCRAFSFALEKDSDAAIDSYVAWAQGYISAFNWSNVRQHDVRIDASAIVLWLGQYCAANPDTAVYSALQILIGNNAR